MNAPMGECWALKLILPANGGAAVNMRSGTELLTFR
jgi:hypothetical protein